MPKSTIHLWVAKKVAENLGIIPSASFLLGNISPDAASLKNNSTKQDKQITHLRQPDFNSGYINAKKIFKEFNDNEFLKGCALHIMLDDLWLKGPYLHLIKKLKEKMPEKKAQLLYLKDLEYIELWFFRQNNSRSLWSAVMSAPPERFFDIFTPGEIDTFRKERYMSLSQKKISTTVSKYITLDFIRPYLEDTAKKLSDEIKQINIK